MGFPLGLLLIALINISVLSERDDDEDRKSLVLVKPDEASDRLSCNDAPERYADMCNVGANICNCCLTSSTECMQPEACKEKGGKCAEALWKPTLSELQQAHENIARPRGNHTLEQSTNLMTNAECVKDAAAGWCNTGCCLHDKSWCGEHGGRTRSMFSGGKKKGQCCTDGTCHNSCRYTKLRQYDELNQCELSICVKTRGVFGNMGRAAVIRLGLDPKVRQLAAHMRVWHWNLFYPTSPYKSSFTTAAMKAYSNSLYMGEKDCRADRHSKSCCIGGGRNRWNNLLDKLGMVKHGKLTKVYKGRSRKFTYAISAPQHSENIEMRIAKMEGGRMGTIFHDANSKHAFLSAKKDWVLYAGELWIQPKLSKGGSNKLDDAMVVMDSNSGTMSPGSDFDTRKKLQNMIMTAFGITKDKVQVCLSPFHMEEGMCGWSEGEDVCPDQKHLYPGVEVKKPCATSPTVEDEHLLSGQV